MFNILSECKKCFYDILTYDNELSMLSLKVLQERMLSGNDRKPGL